MPNSWRADGATLIADLNDLIQLDRDAVETYTVALNSVQDATVRETLAGFRAEHQRRAEALAEVVRGRGAMAIELPHITGPFKIAVQAMGGAIGLATRKDATVLLSLRVVEGQVREKYTRFAAKAWPADIAPIVQGAADEEARHYAWIADQLRASGFGEQSLAGSVGAAAEALHTFVANPIEAAARKVMEFVEQNRPDMVRTRSTPHATIVEAYRNALQSLETDGTVDWMVSLFEGTAVLSSPRSATPEQGSEGARRFWNDYRLAFPTVATTVDSVTEAPGVATLQWTSRGMVDGHDVTWKGITVLEHQGNRITRLLQLYDAAQLAPALA
jgi:rubrerythrin